VVIVAFGVAGADQKTLDTLSGVRIARTGQTLNRRKYATRGPVARISRAWVVIVADLGRVQAHRVHAVIGRASIVVVALGVRRAAHTHSVYAGLPRRATDRSILARSVAARVGGTRIAVVAFSISLAALAEFKWHAGGPPDTSFAGTTIIVGLADRTPRNKRQAQGNRNRPNELRATHRKSPPLSHDRRRLLSNAAILSVPHPPQSVNKPLKPRLMPPCVA